MAKFRLDYTSGIPSEDVEAPEGIERYIAARFGHVNEYLKLGGSIPLPLDPPEPPPQAEISFDQPEETAPDEGSSSGSTEQVEDHVDGASTDEHGSTTA